MTAVSLPAANPIPAARSSQGEPKLARDNSTDSPFKGAFDDQLSTCAGDTHQAPAQDGESQAEPEKPKKDALLTAAILTAIFSAMTPPLPSAGFGAFSAGDEAGPGETGQTEAAISEETPLEVPVALTVKAPAIEDIASAAPVDLAFAVRLVEQAADRELLAAATPAQPAPTLANDSPGVTRTPAVSASPAPQVTGANAAAGERTVPTAPIPEIALEIEPTAPSLTPEPTANAPALVPPAQAVRQDSRQPAQPTVAPVESARPEPTPVEQSGVERPRAEPRTDRPRMGEPQLDRPRMDWSRIAEPRIVQPTAEPPHLDPPQVEQPPADRTVSRQAGEGQRLPDRQPQIEQPASSAQIAPPREDSPGPRRPGISPARRLTLEPSAALSVRAEPPAADRPRAGQQETPRPSLASIAPRAARSPNSESAVTESSAVRPVALPAAPVLTLGAIAVAEPAGDVAPPPGATRVTAVEPIEAPGVTGPTSKVTDISLTVPMARANSAGDERVAIRMVQRGEEIHVSVRAPDPQAAQSLRQDLGRLASSLDDAGFRTETWRPAAVTAASSSAQTHREFSHDSPHRGHTGADSPPGGDPQRGAGEQKRRGQDDRPRWVAELEQQRDR